MRVGPEIHYDAFQAVVAFIAHDAIGERVWQRIASVINLIRLAIKVGVRQFVGRVGEHLK